MAGAPAVETNLGLVVKPNSAVEMVLEGRTVGRAAFEARRNTDGKLLVSLMVSVKPKRPLTYQLCVLSDPLVRLDPAVVSPNLIANMLGAQPIWFKAAHVELTRIGPVVDVQTSLEIGDKTKPTHPIILDPVKVAEIIRATNASIGIQRADIHMYAAWDLRVSVKDDTVGLGDKVTRMGFIEFHLSGSFGSVVAAHEVGHILKLDHPDPLGADKSLLMDGFGQDGFGQDRLRMFEIETANPK